MNIPEKLWKSLMGVFGLLTIFLIVVSVKEIKSIFYVSPNPIVTNTITVEGTGDAIAVPDIATFSFSVTETAKTVADAQDQATAKMNSALKAIRDGGVADKDIQTQSYSINPHYEYQGSVCSTYSCPPSKSILTGYEVSQSIVVKVRDLKKAGTLFTSIGTLGVQNIGNLSFSVDEPDVVKAKARAEAIANAQSKAKELAKQLGVSLVRITSFSENNSNYPRPIYGMGGDMMSAKVSSASPEIPVGEQKVTNSVSITYEIK
ncbi:MAG: SIMPL domain-containing protein [Candidatus Paceibacterota bacterium]|jgi:hypothetical protein